MTVDQIFKQQFFESLSETEFKAFLFDVINSFYSNNKLEKLKQFMDQMSNLNKKEFIDYLVNCDL